MVTTTTYENHTQYSIIHIPAIPANKLIEEIKCRAYTLGNSGQRPAESPETAQFAVQGLLVMPPNVTSSGYNSTHHLIKWLEPETLNITNIEPDIENYTVCTNGTAIQCTNTSKTMYFYPKLSVRVFVEITAWNIAGESKNSVYLIIAECIINNTQQLIPSTKGGMYNCLNEYCVILYIGQEVVLEVEFDYNTTILHITFTSDHEVR